MTIDVIFLGLDGVLFDTEAIHLAACNSAFEEAGIGRRWTAPELRKAARLHGYAAAPRALLGATATRRDKEQVESLCALQRRAFHHAVTSTPLTPLPAALRLVSEALEAGCKLSILTDMPSATAAAMLEQCFGDEVNSEFSVVSSGAKFQGPAATGPYMLALLAMGVEPRNAVAIDSAPAALRAARMAGLWTVSSCPNDIDDASVSGADLWCPQLQELRHIDNSAEQEEQYVSFSSLRGRKLDTAHARTLNLPVPARAAF